MRFINIDAIDYDKYWEKEGFSINDCHRAMKIIEDQPIIDAAPNKTSKWTIIGFPDTMRKWYQCHDCGRIQDKMSDYCPHCGAKMDCTQSIYDYRAQYGGIV